MPLTHSAFLVTIDASGTAKKYVALARDLPDAAKQAVLRVRAAGDAPSRVTSIQWLAPALMGHEAHKAAPLVQVSASAPAQAARSTGKGREKTAASTSGAKHKPKARGSTRAEQLVALLGDNGGQMHVQQIAAGLQVNVVNAQNAVASALKRGLVRRMGKRSGLVALVSDEPKQVQTSSRSRSGGPTRQQQLLGLLKSRREPLHVSAIAAALGITGANTNNLVAAAARRGLVQRGPRGAGLVGLPGQDLEPALAADGRASRPSRAFKVPPGTTRAQQLVLLLRERGPRLHVGEVAGALGITRQHTNNVASRAVASGWVARVEGERGIVELGARAGEVVASRVSGAQVPLAPEIVLLVTRADQVVATLVARGGEAHNSEIAEALGTSIANARACIRSAVVQGLVSYVGKGTGRVVLVEDEALHRRRKRVPPRHEQLVALLRRTGEHMHVREIASALEIRVEQAHGAVQSALAKGLVRRVGRASGIVALSDGDPAEGRAAAEPRPRPSTRRRKVLEALRQAGGEASALQIADGLEISVDGAWRAISQAVRRGWVRRLDNGRVALVAGLMEGSKQPPVDPDTLPAIQKRTLAALRALGRPATAKEIAVVIGGRPRGAGNAAAALVEAKLAVRLVGADKPRYLATP